MGRNGKLSQGMGGNGNQIIHNAFVRNGNGNSSWEWEGMGMKKAFPATSNGNPKEKIVPTKCCSLLY